MSQVSSPVVATSNSWAVRMADSVLHGYPASRWKWHYEHGLVIKAIAAVGAATNPSTGEGGANGASGLSAAVPSTAAPSPAVPSPAVPSVHRFQHIDREWIDHFVNNKGEICTYRVGEFNLDQINPGRLLVPLYRSTGDERYAAAIRLLRGQLQNQPRTPSGGFWHKQIYPNQMWLDGLYMAGPFYAEYALTFGETEIFDDLTHQFILMEQHARDPQTGLLYHAWDEAKVQRWANPVTGCSPHFWGRAIGWYVMALVDVLDYLPPSHPNQAELIAILNRLAHAMICYQDPASGLWYQVVDLPTRPGNYRESSVSAMLAYGFAKAVRRGWLPAEYLSAARRAYHGLLENMIRVDASGALTLEGTCSVAGLGGNPYRDGTFEYYVKEPVATNDFKGVGPFILAALEMDQALERAS